MGTILIQPLLYVLFIALVAIIFYVRFFILGFLISIFSLSCMVYYYVRSINLDPGDRLHSFSCCRPKINSHYSHILDIRNLERYHLSKFQLIFHVPNQHWHKWASMRRHKCMYRYIYILLFVLSDFCLLITFHILTLCCNFEISHKTEGQFAFHKKEKKTIIFKIDKVREQMLSSKVQRCQIRIQAEPLSR